MDSYSRVTLGIRSLSEEEMQRIKSEVQVQKEVKKLEPIPENSIIKEDVDEIKIKQEEIPEEKKEPIKIETGTPILEADAHKMEEAKKEETAILKPEEEKISQIPSKEEEEKKSQIKPQEDEQAVAFEPNLKGDRDDIKKPPTEEKKDSTIPAQKALSSG